MEEKVKQLLEKNEAFVMRDITFRDLKEALWKTYGRPGLTIIYKVGKECGRRSSQRMKKELGLEGKALLDSIVELKKAEKWCESEFRVVDLGKGKINIALKNSFEARGHPIINEFACYFITGYFSGVLSEVMKKDVDLMQVLCVARGDPYCELSLS